MATVTPYPNDERIRQEAETLAKNGYRVSVVCSALSGEPPRAHRNGVEIYRFQPVLRSYEERERTAVRDEESGGTRRRRDLFRYLFGWGGSTFVVLLATVRILATDRVDVIHLHNPPDTLAIAALPSKLAGARVVYDQHDLTPEMYRARARDGSNDLLFRGLLLLERLSYRIADHVIATNESYRAIAVSRGSKRPGDVTVVRNGPLVGRFPQADDVGQDGGESVGYVGIIGYQDGVDELVRAIHHLVVRLGRTEVSCLVVGAGDAFSSVRRLAADLGVEANISFTGWLPHLEAIQRIGRVAVAVEPAPANSYTDKSTMLKIMEYMALGKPVVGFDLSENRVTADGAAVLVPPGDAAGLARAIAALLDDPGRRAEMGAIGRRRVEEQLAWSYSEPNLLSAYTRLLDT